MPSSSVQPTLRTPHCRCWAALGTKTLFSARSSCQVVQSVRGGCVPLYDFHPAFRPVWGSQEVGVNTAPLHSRIFFQSSTLRRNVGHYAQRTTRGERSLPEAEYNGTVDRERVCPKWRKIRGILCQSCPGGNGARDKKKNLFSEPRSRSISGQGSKQSSLYSESSEIQFSV